MRLRKRYDYRGRKDTKVGSSGARLSFHSEHSVEERDRMRQPRRLMVTRGYLILEDGAGGRGELRMLA